MAPITRRSKWRRWRRRTDIRRQRRHLHLTPTPSPSTARPPARPHSAAAQRTSMTPSFSLRNRGRRVTFTRVNLHPQRHSLPFPLHPTSQPNHTTPPPPPPPPTTRTNQPTSLPPITIHTPHHQHHHYQHRRRPVLITSTSTESPALTSYTIVPC